MRRKRRKKKEYTPTIKLKKEKLLGLGLSAKDAGRDISWLTMETATHADIAASHAIKSRLKLRNKTP